MSSIPCLILALNVFFIADDHEHFVFLEQTEGPLVLRDSGDYPGARHSGLKLYQGRLLDVRTSFYVGVSRFKKSVNEIQVSFNATNRDERPIFYDYFVSFFDEDDNLLACCRSESIDQLSPDTQAASTPTFSFPKGLHKSIKYYKVALYESDRELGEIDLNDSKQFTVTSTNANTGKVTITSFPVQPSPGEVRGESIKIREGARRLHDDQLANFKCETLEGNCIISEVEEKEHIWVANQTDVRVRFKFDKDSQHRLIPQANLLNKTDGQRYCQYAIALFDRHGNLVCCINGDERELDPNGMQPEISVNGVAQRSDDSFLGYSSIRLPKTAMDSISCFKMTVFESDVPIGTK